MSDITTTPNATINATTPTSITHNIATPNDTTPTSNYTAVNIASYILLLYGLISIIVVIIFEHKELTINNDFFQIILNFGCFGIIINIIMVVIVLSNYNNDSQIVKDSNKKNRILLIVSLFVNIVVGFVGLIIFLKVQKSKPKPKIINVELKPTTSNTNREDFLE